MKSLSMARVKKTPPVLSLPLQKVLGAFSALAGHRQYHASGPQSLLASEITEYLRSEGQWVPSTQVPKFRRLIRALDAEYLNWCAEQQK